eukprot:7324860-Pyramimonas_sp.AAC.1
MSQQLWLTAAVSRLLPLGLWRNAGQTNDGTLLATQTARENILHARPITHPVIQATTSRMATPRPLRC